MLYSMFLSCSKVDTQLSLFQFETYLPSCEIGKVSFKNSQIGLFLINSEFEILSL